MFGGICVMYYGRADQFGSDIINTVTDINQLLKVYLETSLDIGIGVLTKNLNIPLLLYSKPDIVKVTTMPDLLPFLKMFKHCKLL